MSTREWPRSTLPGSRDPAFWNPMLDGIAALYRQREPGEQYAGLAVVTREGKRCSVLLLEKDGEVRRLEVRDSAGPVGELECERGEEEAC